MKELLANIWIIIKGLGNWLIQLHNADLGPLGDLKNLIGAIIAGIVAIGLVFKLITRND